MLEERFNLLANVCLSFHSQWRMKGTLFLENLVSQGASERQYILNKKLIFVICYLFSVTEITASKLIINGICVFSVASL